MRKIIFIFIFAILGFNCKKEPFTNSNPIATDEFKNNRLNLSSAQFQQIYQKLKQAEKNKPSSFSEPFPDLYSLSDFEPRSNSVELNELIGLHVQNTLGQTRNTNSTEIKTVNTWSTEKQDSLLYSKITEELVEDEPIKHLINDQGEIQVGDTLYKISPYGTLSAHIKDERELRNVYQTISKQNDITVRVLHPADELNYSNITRSRSRQPGVWVLNSHVNFTDTFKESNNYLIMPMEEDGGGGGGGDGGGYTPPGPDNSDPFANMKVEPVDFRNGPGSIWDTFFINHTKYNYFDSEYRVSVLFYNRDYALIKTLGLKVKLQKKGWFWWNKTEAEDMIAGWERIVYKQKNQAPAFNRPIGEAPVFYNPYLVNPYDNPIGGWFSQTKAGLFQWHYAKSSNDLFSIIIPDFLLPPSDNDVTINSSDLKALIPQAWNHLKQILVQSVPQAPLGDPATYKFPVHDIVTGETKYFTIAEIEKMTKSLPSAPGVIEQLALGKKIRNYLGPRQDEKQNVAMIDYDLDFSTATINLSYNLASPISVKRVLNSLSVSDLDNNFEVEDADIFGTVKHNGKWLGIRLIVTVKD